jgi:uncharacterized metal-binding protein YceD (DUF177 family)
MSMLARLFRSKSAAGTDTREALRPLWHRIVELARDPVLFRDDGVADTVPGRFDTITVILSVVLLRFERDRVMAREAALLTELFVEDMDGQLRESGVGDVIVGKKIGKLVSVLGGRLGALREARASRDRAVLEAALAAQRDDAGRPRHRSARCAGSGVRRPGGGARQQDAVRGWDLAVRESELPRPVDLRQILAKPVAIEATGDERAALARRFALVRIDRLEAEVALEVDGEAINAKGRLRAAIVQSCAISGEDLPVAIDEPLALRFVPEKPVVEEEIELEGSALDEIPFDGHAFDLGEAVAQSLALAIDPYAVGPNAERVRKQAGLLDEAAAGPFAALAALKKQ